MNVSELQLYHDFLKTLEKHGKVRHCLDVYDTSMLKCKTWEAALKKEVFELDNYLGQTSFVARSKIDILGRQIVDNVKSSELTRRVPDISSTEQEEISSIVKQLLTSRKSEEGGEQTEVVSNRQTMLTRSIPAMEGVHRHPTANAKKKEHKSNGKPGFNHKQPVPRDKAKLEQKYHAARHATKNESKKVHDVKRNTGSRESGRHDYAKQNKQILPSKDYQNQHLRSRCNNLNSHVR